MKLQVENLWFKYHTEPVLRGVSFNIAPSQMVCLVGPNGSGKSTTIRCIDAILKPYRGRVYIDKTDTNTINRCKLAKRMGYVPQAMQNAFGVSVFDSVLMGRRPHAFWRSSERDNDKVAEVLHLLGLDELAMRNFNELSGGQQQRVIIARALAQEPEIMLLDESTSALDISHQLEVMEILISLMNYKSMAVIMAIHDLNMASRYADRIVMLKEGSVAAEGSPESVFTEENIADVYGVDATISIDDAGKPYILPIRRIVNQSDCCLLNMGELHKVP